MKQLWFAFAMTVLITRVTLGDAELMFRVTDGEGRLLPCRVHLHDESGETVQAVGLSRRIDHFSTAGEQTVSLPPGTFVYGIERSPEWERVEQEVTIGEGERKAVAVTLRRIADLTRQGWYAGDLHIHREPEQIGQLMRSSDLHIGPVITWWNNRDLWRDRALPEKGPVRFDGNRFFELMSGEDEREGGALLYFGLARPIDITGSSREFPSPMKFAEQARAGNPGVHLDIEKPFWWDVPVWLALLGVDGSRHSVSQSEGPGQQNSDGDAGIRPEKRAGHRVSSPSPVTIGLANNHMCRAVMYEDEAWGKPRDAGRLPSPRGNGFWTQEIYYHILNTGLRLPPSAGSASGVLPNPVGYNRVYVHVDGDLTWDGWWNGLRAGRSFVTNGPLLVCRANGELPGTIFSRPASQEAGSPGPTAEPFRATLNITLTSVGHVPSIEIIQNGRVAQSIPCLQKQTQEISTEIAFRESAWFLVRAITDNPRTFRFASTAPFYVEVGEHPRRTSRASAEFFLDWVKQRIDRVPNKLTDPAQLKEVLRYHLAAREFWQEKVSQANAP